MHFQSHDLHLNIFRLTDIKYRLSIGAGGEKKGALEGYNISDTEG